jgi:hypothetical protein
VLVHVPVQLIAGLVATTQRPTILEHVLGISHKGTGHPALMRLAVAAQAPPVLDHVCLLYGEVVCRERGHDDVAHARLLVRGADLEIGPKIAGSSRLTVFILARGVASSCRAGAFSPSSGIVGFSSFATPFS